MPPTSPLSSALTTVQVRPRQRESQTINLYSRKTVSTHSPDFTYFYIGDPDSDGGPSRPSTCLQTSSATLWQRQERPYTHGFVPIGHRHSLAGPPISLCAGTPAQDSTFFFSYAFAHSRVAKHKPTPACERWTREVVFWRDLITELVVVCTSFVLNIVFWVIVKIQLLAVFGYGVWDLNKIEVNIFLKFGRMPMDSCGKSGYRWKWTVSVFTDVTCWDIAILDSQWISGNWNPNQKEYSEFA